MEFLTISELSVALRTRKLSPVEVTDHLLSRIERLDPKLGAYVTVTAARAREQAKVAEREIAAGHWRGPMHGVPMAFKDIIYSDFAPTTAGTRVHRDFRPSYSATVLNRLERVGTVTLGKVKTTEQAFADHHPDVSAPKNPWNAAYWAGSSSSGSGVSPAAGLAYAAIGSDTGGSIRFPSAVNGLTGLKPTWGRVSRYGVFELGATLDHVGPMARSAADCAIILSIIAGSDPADPTALHDPVDDYEDAARQPIGGLRIGIPHAYATDNVDAQIVKMWTEAGTVLKELGATLVPVEFPDWRPVSDAWEKICAPETALAHAPHYPSRADDYGPILRSLLDKGRSFTAMDTAQATQVRAAFANELRGVFRSVDLILIPATVWPTPTIEQWATLAANTSTPDFLRYTYPFDMAGTPTVTFPAGYDDRGLPLALQLAGPHLSEANVLRACAAYQRATNWHARHPADPAG